MTQKQITQVSRQESILSFKQGAAVLALALFSPLAVQGLLLAILWNLAQWGSDSTESVEGFTFSAGSTLSTGLAIIIVLIIRYVVLAAYWTLISMRYGLSKNEGLLAALPMVGIWWSLKISSRIVREEQPAKKLAPEVTVITAGVVALSLLLLPISMQAATANAKGEVRRLAQPCSELFPLTLAEAPVLRVGDYGIGQQEFTNLVNQVQDAQRGAVAKISPSWPIRVANQQVRMALWQQAGATSNREASIADMEQLIALWDNFPGGLAEVRNRLAQFGIPPSQYKWYACSVQTYENLEDKYGDSGDGESPSGVQEFLMKAAQRAEVIVNPDIGYWDLQSLAVVAEPIEETDTLEVGEEVAEEKPEETTRNYSVRVEYGIGSIPTQRFDNSLSWQADICAGAAELTQERVLDRVQLFKRERGTWVRVPGAKATAERGGRCSPGQVNLFIGSTEPEPPINWTDKGWRTCRDYQVRIPETASFRAATVDMCVATRADAQEDGV